METHGDQILLPFPDDGPPTIADINQLWAEIGPQIKSHIFGTPLPDGEKEKRRAWNLVRRGFGSLRNIVFIQETLRKRR
jgi:hypothetical protein